ncbi:MAG: FtsQ-type POTRA domain-containing protein [Gammaproteobacteria bacterium]|nr:FtsQ-type POTRA domain-containing protein [Gammaproteobacteria bacterium]
MLFILGFYIFAGPSHYPIRVVAVQGVYSHVSPHDIQKIIDPSAKRGYFFLRLCLLQRKLEEKLPWVESATVTREWPDKLIITLTEREAVATLNHRFLVTSAGSIFQPAPDTFPPGLFHLLGPKEKVVDLLNNYRLLASIADAAQLSLAELELSPEGDWRVNLSNKTVVMLGNNDILIRFERFIKIYQNIFIPQHREPKYVDMRYSHGMAVNWQT